MNVCNYQSTQRNIPEERRSHLRSGGRPEILNYRYYCRLPGVEFKELPESVERYIKHPRWRNKYNIYKCAQLQPTHL